MKQIDAHQQVKGWVWRRVLSTPCDTVTARGLLKDWPQPHVPPDEKLQALARALESLEFDGCIQADPMYYRYNPHSDPYLIPYGYVWGPSFPDPDPDI